MGIKKFLKNCVQSVADDLFPLGITCLCCNNELPTFDFLCKNCKDKLEISKNVCEKCGAEVNEFTRFCDDCKDNQRYFNKATSCFVYSGTAQTLIYKLKYNSEKYISLCFGKYLANKFLQSDFVKNIDIVTCVPLNIKKQNQRLYNQAEELGKVFQNELKQYNLNQEYKFDLLLRTKNTPTQTNLTKKERKQNLKDAFKLNYSSKAIKGKNILIIDDIFTTGATVEEISKLLKNKGAKEIYVLTVCHTKLD